MDRISAEGQVVDPHGDTTTTGAKPKDGGRLAPHQLLVIAGGSGLLTGLLEVAILYIRPGGLAPWASVGPQVVWMAPVGYAATFVSLALVVVALRSLWPRIKALPLLVAALVFLSLWGLALASSRIDPRAGLLLASGAAFQCARLAGRSSQVLFAIARKWSLGLVGVVVALASGVNGWSAWKERRLLASLPPAPSGAPNVLLLVLDTVGAEWLSTYGYHRPTSPFLSELAGSGVVFDRALSTAPWTLPSHASMFTGRYPHELEADWWVPVDKNVATLAERFSALGYATAGFVGNYAFGVGGYGLGRGFLHYEGYLVSAEEIVEEFALGRLAGHSGLVGRLLHRREILNRKNAREVNAELLRWVSALEGRPFFAFLNYFDSHQPYNPPQPFDRLFEVPPRAFDPHMRFERRIIGVPPEARQRFSPAAIEAEHRAYEATVAYVDSEIRHLVGELARRGLLDNTILVVTGDHGEALGEGNRFLHGLNLYYPVLHVPLIIRFPPQVPKGKRIGEPVSLRDLAATLTQLAGHSEASVFPGKSLAATWWDQSKTRPAPSRVLSTFRGLPGKRTWFESVLVGDFHLIRSEHGGDELYNVSDDPMELHNLLGDQRTSGVVAKLGAILDSANSRPLRSGSAGTERGRRAP